MCRMLCVLDLVGEVGICMASGMCSYCIMLVCSEAE